VTDYATADFLRRIDLIPDPHPYIEYLRSKPTSTLERRHCVDGDRLRAASISVFDPA
jgi:hypothetical protein